MIGIHGCIPVGHLINAMCTPKWQQRANFDVSRESDLFISIYQRRRILPPPSSSTSSQQQGGGGPSPAYPRTRPASNYHHRPQSMISPEKIQQQLQQHANATAGTNPSGNLLTPEPVFGSKMGGGPGVSASASSSMQVSTSHPGTNPTTAPAFETVFLGAVNVRPGFLDQKQEEGWYGEFGSYRSIHEEDPVSFPLSFFSFFVFWVPCIHG